MSDVQALLKQIKREFPDLHWKSYEYIDEGWDHEVIILDGETVFRFPDEDYRDHLKHEIRLLKLVQPLVDVQIPRYSYIAPDYSCAGYPIVPGQALTRQHFDQLAPAERDMFAKQLAQMLSVLHTLLDAGHDLSYVRPFTLYEDQAEAKRETAKYLPQALSKDDYRVAQTILDAVDDILSQPLPEVFIHNDLYDRHLLWDASRQQLGVIDFSDMCIGDPAVDFGEIHEYGEDFVRTVYEYYAGPKDADFLKRAKTYGDWAGVYMMVDHFTVGKTTFAEARETFDRVKKHFRSG